MAQLTFKLHPAKENKRSDMDIILKNRDKIQKVTVSDSDKILSALDTLLKKSKIKLESLSGIKLESSKKAGLTSQRIAKAIVKALCLKL